MGSEKTYDTTRSLTGLLSLGYRCLRRGLGLHLYWVFSRNPRHADVCSPRTDGLLIRELTATEVERFARDPALEIDARVIRAMREQQHLCFGALRGERLVAYTWMSFGTAPHEHGVSVHIRPPRGYGYKAFTRPEYRGRRIWPALVQAAELAVPQYGCDRVLSFIEIDNFASLAAARRIASRRVGFAGYLRAFDRCYTFNSSGARRAGFRFEYDRDESGSPDERDVPLAHTATTWPGSQR